MPALDAPSTYGWPNAEVHTDPLERMAQEDRSDWTLLRLVVCAAVATLALAMASTLPL